MAPPVKVTDEQIIEALRETGNNRRAAARLLGIDARAIISREPKLVLKGWSPSHGMTKTVPDGFKVRGVSTLYDGDGIQRAQWVKSSADDERRLALLQEAVDAMAEPLRGLAKPVKAMPATCLPDSLSSYLIGDAHLGLYAWGKEAGEDFDTEIASNDLRGAIDLLVAGAPPSETAYLVDVGDLLHADSKVAATPQSGNMLDVDGRFPRVVRVAIGVFKYAIARLLEKHRNVEVFVTPGNHNPNAAGMLAMILEAYYDREPRVRIETSPGIYYYRQFGRCLIGITHGDKTKMDQLPAIMATDRAQWWGETQHRYWWTGHIHHTKHQEYRGCFVEAFNTLAASDAWHHASGYRSARQMQRIDLDRTHGIYNRGIASIGMVRAAA